MATPRLLPSPPRTQARVSTTFHPPALDGSKSLPEIYDWHLRHTLHHRLFVYLQEDGNVRTIYWPEAVRAVHVGARMIRKRMGWKPGMEDTPVIAILAPSDTIPYFVTMMSIMRANYIVFPISPRNSAAAVAHLISKVGVQHILVGREPATLDLSKNSLDILRTQYPLDVVPELSTMPLFEDLFPPGLANPTSDEDLPFEYKGPDATVIILHSSGSTAFPKPIYWTNHRCAELALIPWFGERDLTDQILALHTMPMYHAMGVVQLMVTASCGLVVSTFEPKCPAPVPTLQGLFNAAKATLSDVIFCVPSTIEAWSRNPEYVQWLSTRSGVLFGGGPLNQEVGDYLTSQGVKIFILYGSTEAGVISLILPVEVGYDWNYFRISGLVTPKMEPYGHNTYELVTVSNTFCRPSVLNTKVDGIDAYATSDILMPHATKAGYWKVFGRTDDQIMHSTGEKTNPGPLENILNQDTFILASVIFGRGRFNAGVLVDPLPDCAFDPTDEMRLADFRNKIWPTVERMNAYAPQHSRIFKEMIIVSHPSKPFTYTAKSTARRQAILADYEDEINILYDVVEASTQSNIPPPAHWGQTVATDFIRKVVTAIMQTAVTDHDDIFQHGCDSLQATWIRNSILRALRDSTQIDTHKIIINFVYEYPSVASLAVFLGKVVNGNDTEIDNKSRIIKANAMRSMARLHSQGFPPPSTITTGQPPGRAVLLTGSTGSLGCYLLSQLTANPDISRVYALNRRNEKGVTLIRRQTDALVDRGIDVDILESEKVVLLEGDLLADRFGLSDTAYLQMRKDVTHVIHNAWRVDFNVALKTFEADIKGLRNLIDFALAAPFPEPVRLVYTSSIGVFQDVPGNERLLEAPIEPSVAVGTGYSESKWVSEQILLEAAGQTSLRPLIVRVGQLCGGLGGAWNSSEWVPALVQSAEKIKCLPTDPKDVSWLPVHTAASALVELSLAPQVPSNHVVHLIHPRPVQWSTLADILSSAFSVPLVPFKDWLFKVEQLSSTNFEPDGAQGQAERLQDVRALRLLPFFKNIAEESRGDAMGFPTLDDTQAVAFSATLANPSLPQLGRSDVVGWLAYWRRNGLLSAV
ncbi:hypothetical protein BJ138DRAFT_455649 [Hygrophoropsis aurantiaca]|uniref:Uncharacterized protein n=1 Tax=Hygrophoropsis aurantiaca TaxID=72124 RepID=A0ACB8A4W0_9AGAM|nr:hypothetical protein BJ138DRAFT_455649 [Hygrophoropsis aurantiaca]